ncbi:MAG: endonuclease [Kiritimatiellae bacterium]|nr:endonuclease [Kiritimatiellia bacterium]
MNRISIRNGLACAALWGMAAAAMAGSGTENDPYTIAEALALPAGTTEYWAQGYIVGGRYDDFDSPWTGDYGLSCADNDSETDVNNCLQVKLESDGGRDNWGLASNPGHYLKQIKFQGYRDSYGGYPSFEGINYADISEVSASSQLPEFGANPGPLSATVGVARAFTVTATGSPDPVLALDSTTASGGYSFTAGTGELSYTPPPADGGETKAFTFTASNSAGVATQTVSVAVSTAPESAPVFNANPGPVAATAEVTVAFTVSANGNPVPALALDSTTAAAESYLFEPATGYCVYEPPTNDVGAQTFTFSASNTQGTAVQTVTVNVAAAPVYIPTVTLTNIGTNSFTIHWTEVTDAAAYQVQIATDTNFTPGSAGGGLLISEVADPADNANARFVELYNASGAAIDFSTAVWTLCRQANGSTWGSVQLTGTLAAGGTHVVAYNQATYESVYGDTADQYDGSISGNGDDGYFLYSGGDYSFGTLVDAYGVVDQDGSGFAWEYTDSQAVRDSTVTFPTSTWTSSEWTITGANASGMTPHAHTVTGGGGGEGGTLVADMTVGALSTNVTGLDMETTYYVRVRAAPTGTWSTVVLATTTGGEPTAPSFTSGTGPYSVTAGGLVDFTVSAMGTPVPVLALEASTASTNDYAFEPSTGTFLYQPLLSDGGTVQTFTFTASNTEGTATQTVTVNVAAASAPVFEANPGPLTATTGVVRTFTVSATGEPEPELALQSATASGGTYSFTSATGLLGYTPPPSDLGTQSFTFTAGNTAGVATQTVSVTVVALPTIDSLPPLYIEAGQTSNLWVVAQEAEGDALTLTASNLPANASFTTASGTLAVSNQFTFSPSSNQAGQAYAVVFYASDVHGTTTRTLNITVANNDPWADYYAACYSNGVLKTGDELKNALHDIISNHTYVAYGSQTDTVLRDIDECPTNSSMVQCLYLQHGLPKFDGSWNKEHVWAQSHGIDGANPAYSDVHHLHPTLIQANSDRNSRDFDIVSGTTTNYAFDGTQTAGNFEPPLAGKGDVARAMFYMAVRYDGTDAVGDLELTNATPTSTESALFGKLDTLLDWNELDPVNDYEIRRNNLVYSNYQGNRNPFVDHPEWVRVVFDTNYLALPTLTEFTAEPNGTDRIDVGFAYSGTGDGVVIVWDGDGSFDTPTGTAPAVGQPFAGGTVLYKGSSSPQSHTGLSPCQTVHYKCWTYVGTNYAAAGTTASATTAGPDAPASTWASATNATDFTAAWSGVSGVTEYVLDVATGQGFSGSGDGWSTIFRESMGTSAGTVTLADHEAADGFDNDGYTMSGGGAENPADIRSSSGSGGYIDPAGNLASSNANVYFTATGVTNLGFAIEGIDTTGCEALALSFGYRKEDAAANMSLGVEWSTNSGAAWSAVTVSNLPAEAAATGWYMVSNLAVSAAALDSTNLSLRWTKNGGVAGRIDDVLLQGYQSEALFVPGYSNRAVSGATSAAVTGLTAGATYYFRVASVPNCDVRYSPAGVVTTLQTLAAPAFGANPGPFGTTVDVQVAFTVSASGSPQPVLALEETDAQAASYSFDPETGQLVYTPALAETGERSFTFTAANTQGVATQIVAVTVYDWPAQAPAFTSGTSYGATTGVAMVFTVAATGYPEPVLALAGATASGGYSFTPATGQLAYTPPEADVGSPTFTFTAGNASGVATQTVTVTVAAGVPSAPAVLWAAETNVTGFTAEWTPVAIATGYWLDVSTEADFQVSGGESVETVLASNAAASADMITNGWVGTDLGGDLYVIMTQATAAVVSPAFSTVGQTNLAVDFEARTYGGSTSSNITVSVSTNNGTDWTVLAVVNPSNGSAWVVMPTVSDAAHLGHAQTRIRWQALDAAAGVGVGIQSLRVSGWAPGTVPAYVAGYANRFVAGTSQAVTGLTENTPYYFRVRAENNAGTSVDSATAGVVTKQKSAQTIEFPAIGAQWTTSTVPLSATASSGLAVSFAVAGGPGVVEGSTLAFTGAGDVVVVASQGGNEDWNPAPDVTNLLTVSKAPAGVTLGSLTQDYDGTPKSATATTEPAGLTVEFTYDGDPTAPTAAGSYAVTGTVNDAVYQGSATGTLLIAESLTPFQLWVRDEQGQSLSDSNFVESADYDGDGATTEEEYLADTDPASAGSVLELDGTYVNKTQAGGETGEMRFTFPASSARYYQLIYSADLSATLTNNLGWGVPDMVVTNTHTGTWFGTLRVLLNEP